MDVNFVHTDAEDVDAIVFEKVLGEKSGGGMVANPDFDIPVGTAIGLDGDTLKPIKAFRLVKAVLVQDTEIEIAKGSGVAKDDIIAHGNVGVKCSAVDTTNSEKDVVTVTMGIAIPNDTVLYEGDVEYEEAVPQVVAEGHVTQEAVPATLTAPKYAPAYLTGSKVFAGLGDQATKLVVSAIVRKETVNAAPAVLALLPTINAV